MIKTLEATFDGNALLPDELLALPPNSRVQITIETVTVPHLNPSETTKKIRVESTTLESEKNTESEINQALYVQSLFFAELARQETEIGNATFGILLALEALPKSMSQPNRPYVVEAEAQLYQAIYNLREQAVLTGHENSVTHAAFSSDGQRVVTASSDGTARLWNTKTGQALAVLTGHESPVTHATFSPVEAYLVTASGDGTARLWDANTGQSLAVLLVHESPITYATFSPEGKHIVTASSDKTARLWETHTAKLCATLKGHKKVVVRVAFSPDGQRILTVSADKTAGLWDVSTGKQLTVLSGYLTGFIGSLVHLTERLLSFKKVGKNRLTFFLMGNKYLSRLIGHKHDVLHAAFSPDGQRVVTTSDNNVARLWDVETGKQLRVLKGHTDDVLQATFSPNGQYLVTASADETARIWNVNTGQQLTLLTGHKSAVIKAAFSADELHLLTVSDDGTARLWNVNTAKTVTILVGRQDEVNYAAFSPDGQQVVTASRNKC